MNEMNDDTIEALAEALAVRIGPPAERRLWNIAQCAAYLGIAQSTLSNMISAGQFIPHTMKIGSGPKARRWTEKSVTDWAISRQFAPGRPRNAA